LRWWLRFVAIQLVVTLALLEIALRVFNPLPFRVRGERIVLPVFHRATYRTVGPRLDPVVYNTRNSLGFRGPEPPRDFARSVSIVTIGGSTTECRLLTDGKTWPDALARKLSGSIPNVWVNNAGFDGHSTHGHAVLLEQAVVALHPAIALFLVGANDVGVPDPNAVDQTLVANPGRMRRAAQRLFEHVEVLALAQNLWRYSQARREGLGHAWTTIDTAETLVMSAPEIDAEVSRRAPAVEGYKQRLARLIEISRGAGIEPVFMTQPALYPHIDIYTGKNTATLRVSDRGNGELDARLNDMNNNATREVARRESVFLIDLAREMPADSRLYYDFVHYSNEGAALVGEIVARHLGPFLRSRFSDRLQRVE
jgi:lysophospholipase L1-like esterase